MLFLDEGFDGGAWPGPHGRRATAGEAWLGWGGLLGHLEGRLGLSGRRPGPAARVGALARRLQAQPGFWSRSAEADALSTARAVLDLRDTLALHGWRGEGPSARLRALSAVTEGLPPGVPERLQAVRAALEALPDVREAVELFETLDGLPPRWREVVTGAAAPLRAVTPGAAAGAPGLAAARAGAFEPGPGEQALQLIRPLGPLQAADQVAAALAASREVPTVIIGADVVLDAALRRHGLPTTGAAGDGHGNAVGALLPLVVALAARPPEPQRVLELLTLPASPIRRDVAHLLARALQQWPAVGSPAWEEALGAFAARATASEVTAVREQLGAFVGAGGTSTRGWTKEALETATSALGRWLRDAEAAAPTDEAQARYLAAQEQVDTFRELLAHVAPGALTAALLHRALEHAHEALPRPVPFRAQAGLVAVASPAALVAPVPRVVWWGFTRASAPTPRRLPLGPEDLAALASLGLELPSPGAQAARVAARYRRPLEQATQALWLVCPHHDEAGEEAAPHPLWDEVTARASRRAHLSRLVHDVPQLPAPAPLHRRRALARPAPRREWRTTTPPRRRALESPSSVEDFLGCSLKWTLHYGAQLRHGETAALAADERLLGSLAHHVLLERVFKRRHASADDAEAAALVAFDAEVPSLAAPLFRPGADEARRRVRTATARTARAIQGLVERGWAVVATETPLTGRALGTRFAGTVDLLLGSRRRRAIVDLKWSGETYRRRSLAEGTALQLAAYAELLRQAGHAAPTVAYLIITNQALLTTDPRLASRATALAAAVDSEGTWAHLKAAHQRAWRAAQQGRLTAPGVGAEPPDTTVADGALTVAPPCRFCDYAGLCGRRYGVEEATDGDD